LSQMRLNGGREVARNPELWDEEKRYFKIRRGKDEKLLNQVQGITTGRGAKQPLWNRLTAGQIPRKKGVLSEEDKVKLVTTFYNAYKESRNSLLGAYTDMNKKSPIAASYNDFIQDPVNLDWPGFDSGDEKSRKNAITQLLFFLPPGTEIPQSVTKKRKLLKGIQVTPPSEEDRIWRVRTSRSQPQMLIPDVQPPRRT